MNRRRGFWIVLWAVLVLVVGYLAFGRAHFATAYGPWHGGGHMGAWDVGAHCPGCGWDGMRAHDGRGLFRPHGGTFHGMDPFMAPAWPPDLSEEQAAQILKLQDEKLERDRTLLRQEREARLRLDRLFAAEKRDWDAIRAEARKLSDLQRQQMDAGLEIQQKIDGLLTDAQRRQMNRSQRDCRRQ